MYRMPRNSSPSRNPSAKSHISSLPKTPPVVFRNPYSSVGHPVPSATAPTFGQSIKDGFGLGVGSAIAQRVVGSILGHPTLNVTHETPKQKQPCEKELLAFENCMKTQSMETFCGQEQTAFVNCIKITGPIHSQ